MKKFNFAIYTVYKRDKIKKNKQITIITDYFVKFVKHFGLRFLDLKLKYFILFLFFLLINRTIQLADKINRTTFPCKYTP